MKEFCKSVVILQSYGQESSDLFFDSLGCSSSSVCLFSWCLTALSAQIGYIVPQS